MGERFTLIDPARLPEKPVFPNMQLVLLIALVLGLGAGVAVAALQEFADQSAHTVEDLARAIDMPVFTGITNIITREDILNKKIKLKRILITTCVVLVVGLLVFHFFIMDLDVLWAKINRRFL
jgi:polysaccharide biosynthesis transport protein